MIDNHVPDATFVDAVAKLTHPKPEIQTMKNGQQLWMAGKDKELFGQPQLPEPAALDLSTLSAVVAAYKALSGDVPNAANAQKPLPLSADQTGVASAWGRSEMLVIQVVDEVTVRIVSPDVGEERQQFHFLSAKAPVPALRYGQWQDMEMFNIGVLANFLASPERDRLLALTARLSAGVMSEVSDNGATQSVSVKKGIVLAGPEATWKNPVTPAPYRTFPEVHQPESAFVFRMRSVKNGDEYDVSGVLVEGDGGAWKREAIANIGDYLRDQLPNAIILA